MQPTGMGRCGVRSAAARLRLVFARCAAAAALALTLGGALGSEVVAADPGPVTTGASNGGIASASSGGEITIGQTITGENTGNSIVTGNIEGAAELHGGEIDYPTNVNVSQDSAPLIVTADGGDHGQASPPEGDGPEVDIDIDNEDRNSNDNRSDATGIGEGGEGGEGGDGGSVIIGDEPVD